MVLFAQFWNQEPWNPSSSWAMGGAPLVTKWVITRTRVYLCWLFKLWTSSWDTQTYVALFWMIMRGILCPKSCLWFCLLRKGLVASHFRFSPWHVPLNGLCPFVSQIRELSLKILAAMSAVSDKHRRKIMQVFLTLSYCVQYHFDLEPHKGTFLPILGGYVQWGSSVSNSQLKSCLWASSHQCGLFGW